MWAWLEANVTTLQVLVSIVSTGVWIAYLNLFLTSYRRQTRSSILISRAGAQTYEGRCLVSNMGSEPAFLTDVLAEFKGEDGCRTISVVDRLELWEQEESPINNISAEGPIASGEYVDIGSFAEIFKRAEKKLGGCSSIDGSEQVNLIAIAATNQARDLIAASRTFKLVRPEENGMMKVQPTEVEAKQIRSRSKRKSLKRILGELQTRDSVERAVSGDLG